TGGVSEQTGRQASGEGRLHGSGDGLPLSGEKAFSAGAYRSRPVPCDPRDQSSLPGLLERTGCGRSEESGLAFADEAAPASSEAGAACAALILSARESGDGSGLPVQTEALLSAVEQKTQSEKVPGTGAQAVADDRLAA